MCSYLEFSSVHLDRPTTPSPVKKTSVPCFKFQVLHQLRHHLYTQCWEALFSRKPELYMRLCSVEMDVAVGGYGVGVSVVGML